MTPEDFARERHAGQPRKGADLPYVIHPEGDARILARLYPDLRDLEAAGWLQVTVVLPSWMTRVANLPTSTDGAARTSASRAKAEAAARP